MEKKTHALWDSHMLGQIVDSMADGVFTLDIKGRITSWNRAMERITGFTANETLGNTCALLNFNQCFGKKCPASLKACGILKRGLAEVKECFLQHKDGHEVSIIKNANVVKDENDKIIGVVETITDLSELRKARFKAEAAARRLKEIHQLGNIIGKSHEMQQVFTAIRAAAASDATVLIQGDSGTGKELVAGAIHYHSDRAENPLITVNCSALPESLIESELFGHARGAFTGATRERAGRFEEAEGGTIFLDEIGELTPFIQVKLLRVLQEREIERIGESKRRKVNIRIIAATHQNLFKLVQEGKFRDDLYYRLKVFPIHLPPLRKRKDDIPLLVRHFIDIQNKKTGKQIKNLSQEAMRIFMDYPWPGNVRELENAIEHAFVLCNKEQIEENDLPVEIRKMEYQPFNYAARTSVGSSSSFRKKISKKFLLELLDECDWNKAEVGRRIGLSRTAIWKYMKKWEIPLRNTTE
jgi:two-component system response regulator HydG